MKEQHSSLTNSVRSSLAKVDTAIVTTVQQNTQKVSSSHFVLFNLSAFLIKKINHYLIFLLPKAKAEEQMQETQEKIDTLLRELSSLDDSKRRSLGNTVTDTPSSGPPENALNSHSDMLQVRFFNICCIDHYQFYQYGNSIQFCMLTFCILLIPPDWAATVTSSTGSPSAGGPVCPLSPGTTRLQCATRGEKTLTGKARPTAESASGAPSELSGQAQADRCPQRWVCQVCAGAWEPGDMVGSEWTRTTYTRGRGNWCKGSKRQDRGAQKGMKIWRCLT